jgi:glycosyltransferase involved in cell wall biosynthesis
LLEQTKSLAIPFEIIAVDDFSTPEIHRINKRYAECVDIRYLRLDKNIGRSAIRNFLCREAKYESLLFIDCDSKIVEEKYLENYLPYLYNNNGVVYGGTRYQDEVPGREYYLHWKYGKVREIQPVDVRQTFPTRFFKTNNFLITKEILTRHPFDESIKEYGHEDTVLGITFYQNDISVVHIENPVLHDGLEPTEVFLSKTKEGVRNLVKLYATFPDRASLLKHIHLLNAFARVDKFKLTFIFRLSLWIIRPVTLFLVRRFFLLWALDVYKLALFCSRYNRK